MEKDVNKPLMLTNGIQFLRFREVELLNLFYNTDKPQITFSRLVAKLNRNIKLQKFEQCSYYAKNVLCDLNIISQFKEKNGIGIPGEHIVFVQDKVKVNKIVDQLKSIEFFGSGKTYKERNLIVEVDNLLKLNTKFSLDNACELFDLDREICRKLLRRNELVFKDPISNGGNYTITEKGITILNTWKNITSVILNRPLPYYSLADKIFNERLVA